MEDKRGAIITEELITLKRDLSMKYMQLNQLTGLAETNDLKCFEILNLYSVAMLKWEWVEWSHRTISYWSSSCVLSVYATMYSPVMLHFKIKFDNGGAEKKNRYSTQTSFQLFRTKSWHFSDKTYCLNAHHIFRWPNNGPSIIKLFKQVHIWILDIRPSWIIWWKFSDLIFHRERKILVNKLMSEKKTN